MSDNSALHPKSVGQPTVDGVILSDMTSQMSNKIISNDTPVNGAEDKSLLTTGLRMVRAQEVRNLLRKLQNLNLTTTS